MTMDKQQAAREAFEDWARTSMKAGKTNGLARRESGEYLWSGTSLCWDVWQAAQAALMPALVEARYAFRAIETTGLNNVCSGWDAKHVRDHNITMAQNALARLNAIIGDKK